MKIIDDFEAAVRLHEMRGAQRPEDWANIELCYAHSKRKLAAYINRLTKERKNENKRSHKPQQRPSTSSNE